MGRLYAWYVSFMIACALPLWVNAEEGGFSVELYKAALEGKGLQEKVEEKVESEIAKGLARLIAIARKKVASFFAGGKQSSVSAQPSKEDLLTAQLVVLGGKEKINEFEKDLKKIDELKTPKSVVKVHNEGEESASFKKAGAVAEYTEVDPVFVVRISGNTYLGDNDSSNNTEYQKFPVFKAPMDFSGFKKGSYYVQTSLEAVKLIDRLEKQLQSSKEMETISEYIQVPADAVINIMGEYYTKKDSIPVFSLEKDGKTVFYVNSADLEKKHITKISPVKEKQKDHVMYKEVKKGTPGAFKAATDVRSLGIKKGRYYIAE